MVKLAEGGFNKVFRLVMDNGSAVIARIPMPNTGSSRWSTASEVVTMNFNADFWDRISSLVQREGWTSHETYGDAVELFSQLRQEGLRLLEGEETRTGEAEVAPGAESGTALINYRSWVILASSKYSAPTESASNVSNLADEVGVS
ncbi:hypothetical protein F5B22DRAFT_648767 [Xylaria bambusicola]|uniref:uncharacterized protein n=1 Tax=Xylaria bambusicola TaxID=326684 RepID=UPI0020086861|nr:uncharacterized protein F5B22DRAFT_648767 [Xylaria bambusicola]KAI0509745.1 hypothetical protein F5B22DRAFT_648767 [Xylaria bambusicola]